MSSAKAPVAVVIATWNSAAFLRECLASLRSLERPPEEIVLVDGGSADDTVALVRREYKEVLLLAHDRNLGFCKATNLGIARTRSPFVLALNPDTRLSPGFLEKLLPSFEDPRVGIACGKLLRFDGETIDSAGQELGRSRQPKDRGYGRPDRGQYDRDQTVFGACAAAALYRRAMVESVADPGGEFFDEAFFTFYEDVDVAWRARRLGWTAVYRHAAVGYHLRGGTAADPAARKRFGALFGRSATSRFHIAKNRYLLILRNDSPSGYLRNLPWIVARDLATLGLLALLSPRALVRLWRARGLYRRALERRRLDAGRAGHHVQDRASVSEKVDGRSS